MAGKPDTEVALAALDRCGPETKRIRDEIDRKQWLHDPAWCPAALNALSGEDRELEGQEKGRVAHLNNQGRSAGSDREAMTLRAARLRLRETIAEVSGIALEVCASSPSDISGAKTLLMRQRAEFWSLRTGYGAQRDTLQALPRPRGRRPDLETIKREADVLAALRMAENSEQRDALLRDAAENGMNASVLNAQHEGKAVVEDPLEEAVRRRVTALEEERSRDQEFATFLILNGWVRLGRRVNPIAP